MLSYSVLLPPEHSRRQHHERFIMALLVKFPVDREGKFSLDTSLIFKVDYVSGELNSMRAKKAMGAICSDSKL